MKYYLIKYHPKEWVRTSNHAKFVNENNIEAIIITSEDPSSAVLKAKEFLLEDFAKFVDIHLIENIRGGNNL